MSLSLREQLLQAGLGSRKQAEHAERQQRQQSRNKAAVRARQEEQRRRAAEAQAAKAARDEALNRQRQEQAERKARWAQIKQLIEQHRLVKVEGEDYVTFNFIDRQKVRRLTLEASLRERLIGGQVVIVRCEGRYDIVPADIAERIREREPRAVITLSASESPPDDNDPYKEYVVPDDLMW